MVTSDGYSSNQESIFHFVELDPYRQLKTFREMWQEIFLWFLLSSILVHFCAAVFAFFTLRKHKFGRFFSILIVVMGILSPATGGVFSSAAIAFVHRASSMQMSPVMAMI